MYLSRERSKVWRLSQAFVKLLVGGPWGGDSLPRKRIPSGSHTGPSRAWPISPLLAEGFFPLRAREGLGEVPDRAEWQGFLGLEHIFPPPPTVLPQPDIQAPSSDPQLGPDPQPPSPLFPRISGGGSGSAHGRTFFCQKRQGCSCTRLGNIWIRFPA